MADAGNTEVPEGFVEVRRGRAVVLVRADLAEVLLDARVDDPAEFLRLTPPTRTFRGRARAALVELPRDDGTRLGIVLRVYRHGGLMGALGGGLFARGDRACQEMRALLAAREAGIRTARPVAAVRRAVPGPVYRAHLVTEVVAGARDLVDWLEARRDGEEIPDPARVLEGVGRALHELHDAGIDVPDLHVRNVLVERDEPSRPVLIDFDRARVRPGPVPRGRRLRDLFRFDRSVEKLGRCGPPVARRERARLFRGYLGREAVPEFDRRSACRRYRVHMALHRAAWALRGR